LTATPTAQPAVPPDGPAAWLALTASERGASHVAAKTANQDAIAVERAGPAGLVAAVADGHGHWRHPRSARGSRLAVTVGCLAGRELADKLARELPQGPPGAATTASQIARLVREVAVPDIVRRWRDSVFADVRADPFTGEEQGRRHRGDDPTIAYGSTLLLGVATSNWLILAQIGDGDVVAVRADGSSVLPVPADPQLDGLVTTSLCGPDPGADFRIAVLDTARTPLLAVLLATDGYGNAQVADDWPGTFGKDLRPLVRAHEPGWLAGQLPGWAARCASSDGSADDTTIALLIPPAGLAVGAAAQPGGAGRVPGADLGSAKTTAAVVVRADTVPSAQVPAGQSPIEPVTVRRTVPMIPAEPGSVTAAHQEERGPEAGKPEAGAR